MIENKNNKSDNMSSSVKLLDQGISYNRVGSLYVVIWNRLDMEIIGKYLSNMCWPQEDENIRKCVYNLVSKEKVIF